MNLKRDIGEIATSAAGSTAAAAGSTASEPPGEMEEQHFSRRPPPVTTRRSPRRQSRPRTPSPRSPSNRRPRTPSPRSPSNRRPRNPHQPLFGVPTQYFGPPAFAPSSSASGYQFSGRRQNNGPEQPRNRLHDPSAYPAAASSSSHRGPVTSTPRGGFNSSSGFNASGGFNTSRVGKDSFNIWIIVEPIPQTIPTPSSTISTSSSHFISVTTPTLITTNSISTSINSNLVGTTPTSKDTNDSSKWWIIGGIITFVFCISVIIIIITFFIKRKNSQKRLECLKIEMQDKFELSPLEKQLSRDIRSKMHLNHKNVRIDFDELIGKGSNACVYKAYIKGETCLHAIQKRIETSHFVDCEAAVKIPKTFDTDEIEEFVRELDALITINHHPHVIALFGWSMHQSVPCLVTELADIDLLTYVRSLRNEELPMTSLLSILWQITQALEFVASLLMVHRDVACRNILLMNNHKMVKLGDFGLCCHCDESLTYKASLQKRFPLKWLSIEALLDRIFSEKSDVWSFGVLCFEVYSYGAVPYPALSNVEMLEFIQSGGRLEKPNKTPEGMYEIMLDCWNELPQKRPSFKELGQRLRKMLEEESAADGYLKIVEV